MVEQVYGEASKTVIMHIWFSKLIIACWKDYWRKVIWRMKYATFIIMDKTGIPFDHKQLKQVAPNGLNK